MRYDCPIMLFRIADLSDLDDLVVLVIEFRDHLRRTHPETASLRESIRRLIETGDAEFLLSLDAHGRAVGYIQQRYRHSLWLSGPEACLEDLFVTPSSRRQGVAKGLVQFAIQRAGEVGCRSIKLDTSEMNYSALRLYEGLGFSSGSTLYASSRQLTLEKVLDAVT